MGENMERNHNFIDMTGWEMWNHGQPDSKITVLSPNDTYWIEKGLSRKQLYWNCKCQCGKVFQARAQFIRDGRTKSCGCYHQEVRKKLMEQRRDKYDLTGKRFEKLLVLSDSGYRNGTGNILWKCLCDCGKISYVSTSNIQSGSVKSCGCTKRGRPSKYNGNYIGKKYGKLTVIEHLKTEHTEIEYLCKCDCGNIRKVYINELLSGKVTSCGCVKSSGERVISEILNENNIPFIREKTYSDCLGESNIPLRYDFYVNNNFLLEFDGIQHFETSTGGWNNEERLIYTQKHDKIKNDYAKKNNIPLKRIPYWDFGKITLENIMSDKWLINNE